MDDHIDFYRQHLNLYEAAFSRIDHGDAIVAVVYKVTLPTGEQLILKICPRAEDFLREVYFLNYFADSLPVPRIVQTVPPTGGINGAVLMECLPGALLKVADLTDVLAYEIGSMLAHIHANRTLGYGELIDANTLEADPKARFVMKLEEGFAECSKQLPRILLERCRRFYDVHVDLLHFVDGPCMIHRDFRPGNLIIFEGRLHGIIDWSAGRASFAQEDFCALEHGEWPSCLTPAFLAGYASIRPVPEYQEMMPFLRMARALATIGFTVKRNTWKTSNANLYQSNRRYLEKLCAAF